MHEQGWKQKDIATALGVTEGAVSQWFKKVRAQGIEAFQILLRKIGGGYIFIHRLFLEYIASLDTTKEQV
jgi:predicted transcriptional regulator